MRRTQRKYCTELDYLRIIPRLLDFADLTRYCVECNRDEITVVLFQKGDTTVTLWRLKVRPKWPGSEVLNFFMLNSIEHEIFPAHKC